MLRNEGLADDAIDEHLAAWCARFGKRYAELLAGADTSRWQAAPGAAEALSRIEEGGIQLALLTGNPEPMARARMERLGLAGFFPTGQGAFGCDAEERVELLAIARRRAGDWPAERTVEIGDTPRDVESAHGRHPLDRRPLAAFPRRVPRSGRRLRRPRRGRRPASRLER